MLAAAFPAPGRAFMVWSGGLTVSVKNFAPALLGDVPVIVAPKVATSANSVTVSVVRANEPSVPVIITSLNATCQIFGALGSMLGPQPINLNQPANCFSLTAVQPQFVSGNMSLQVQSAAAATASVKVLVLGTPGLWSGQIIPLAAPSLPALAATVLGLMTALAYERKKRFVGREIINYLAAGLNVIPARLEILRC